MVSPWVGLSVVKHLEEKYGTPFLHIDSLPVGAASTSRFLRKVSEYAGLNKDETEKVITYEEKRFYEYLVTFSDFVAEQRNILPYELYTVGDSLYTGGVTEYLTNELGFIPQGVYVIDDPSKENEKYVKDAFKNILPEYEDKLVIEADGGLITKAIEDGIGKSKKALILGSYWERVISKETNNYFVNLSLPVTTEIITNSSYVGYDGGLTLVEKIYTNAFNRGNLSSRTHVE